MIIWLCPLYCAIIYKGKWSSILIFFKKMENIFIVMYHRSIRGMLLRFNGTNKPENQANFHKPEKKYWKIKKLVTSYVSAGCRSSSAVWNFLAHSTHNKRKKKNSSLVVCWKSRRHERRILWNLSSHIYPKKNSKTRKNTWQTLSLHAIGHRERRWKNWKNWETFYF